ncbi:MAG: hypothetical protein ACLSH6_10200 [Limosilactobacillus pontis]
MLMNLPHNSGAELLLDQGIKFDLSFDPDDYSQEWAFAVKDPGEQVSFFDILLPTTWFGSGTWLIGMPWQYGQNN